MRSIVRFIGVILAVLSFAAPVLPDAVEVSGSAKYTADISEKKSLVGRIKENAGEVEEKVLLLKESGRAD